MNQFPGEVYPGSDSATPADRGAKWRRYLKDGLETLLLSIVLFLAVNAVSARIRVESVSMQPTLNPDDFVIVNKLAYRLGSPSRGDVIVFKYPPDPGSEPYIKRVIGLPGDRVHIADGDVYVNGILLIEPYLPEATRRGGDWLVPGGNLFVLGDNRNNSSDSRAWGMVPLDLVIGKAALVYWPPQKWGSLDFQTATAAEP